MSNVQVSCNLHNFLLVEIYFSSTDESSVCREQYQLISHHNQSDCKNLSISSPFNRSMLNIRSSSKDPANFLISSHSFRKHFYAIPLSVPLIPIWLREPAARAFIFLATREKKKHVYILSKEKPLIEETDRTIAKYLPLSRFSSFLIVPY